jgi:Ca2+/Na+ antiporter
VKPTKTQIVFAYVASISLMLVVFHRPLGLADYWEWVFLVICFAAWITFFALRRKQKARASEPEQIVLPPSLSRQKNIRRLSLFLIIAVSLASFWWLPFTGTRLPFPQMVIVAISTCITSVTIYLVASRRAQQGSNQSLEPTAGRRDD